MLISPGTVLFARKGHNMTSKYLIKPETILYELGEVKNIPGSHLGPIGENLINEINDVAYDKGQKISYHEHDKGYDTFLILKGSVLVKIRGKQCIATEGDIIHVRPYISHGFEILEDNTLWREMFQNMDMHQGLKYKELLKESCPEKLSDKDFMKQFRQSMGTIERREPKAIDVDKSELPEVRVKGEALSAFKFDGIVLNQKIGRFETNGVKEVWEVIMTEGMRIEYGYPHCNWNVYSIGKGSFEFKVGGEQFTAYAGDIVNIPPYTTYEFISAENDASYYNLNCKAMLLRLLEDIESSDDKSNRELIGQLMKEHGCWVTGYEAGAQMHAE